MKLVRTPEDRFQNLPGYSFSPHYVDVDDGEGAARIVSFLERIKILAGSAS